ncbi:hypothetical protein N5C66_15005 [Rhizobium pusense]|uniref:Uncharacterized protein n=1 Tax=Agrobacterium genomosp. 2 str. CFBP 5494 TaxID=1183436 RepID=A0A9W5AYS0_9HYPH|nr:MULTISPECIES: hypothetical protein [Rhizobium/Agrobacterium group]HCJ72569.1 hypothetical protein [Agrobacterium sp.]MDH0910413.1 hypothetical protein [Agrobacterium pusense]MDH1096605.1 hypothetical protein [Agrobacterium pusense]MDH1113050.1 hypothetical protein [Agrobacterium pusense]MDH2195395.1 hypothetical protein [Agrobacterium pusense]
MTIKEVFDEDAMTIAFRISFNRNKSKIIAELNEVIPRIKKSLSREDVWYRVIDVSGKWSSDKEDFEDPWTSPNADAWVQLANHSEFLEGLHVWFGDLENLLALHLQEKHASIRETDEVLLGEVPLSILAVTHLDFVPVFTRFLDVWDDPAQAQQHSVVMEIVQSHGRCPAVEDLLVKLVAQHGGDGDLIQSVLRPLLEKLYGDFPGSKLFRRMVETTHAMGTKRQDSEGNRYIFLHCPDWPELKVSATAILAELDA